MDIYYSPEFKRRFRKLSRELKVKAFEKEKIFRKDQFHPQLKTHKLSGKRAGRWAFWIDFKCRVMFSFIDSKTIHFLSVGDHDIYK